MTKEEIINLVDDEMRDNPHFKIGRMKAIFQIVLPYIEKKKLIPEHIGEYVKEMIEL